MDVRTRLYKNVATNEQVIVKQMLQELDEDFYLDGKLIVSTAVSHKWWVMLFHVLDNSADAVLENVSEVFDHSTSLQVLHMSIESFNPDMMRMLFVKCFNSYKVIVENNNCIFLRACEIYSFCYGMNGSERNCLLLIEYGFLEEEGIDPINIPEKYPKFKQHWEECKPEVEKMKSFFLPIARMTLFNFVKLKSESESAYYLGDSPVSEILTEVNQTFNIYKEFACYKILAAAKRRKWLNLYHLIFDESIIDSLEPHIKRRIGTYLTNAEIKDLVDYYMPNIASTGTVKKRKVHKAYYKSGF